MVWICREDFLCSHALRADELKTLHRFELGVSARERGIGKLRKIGDRAARLLTPKKNEETPPYLRCDEELQHVFIIIT